MKMKPIADYVLVKAEEAEKRTKSGIIITEGEGHIVGEVIAVGPGLFSQNGQKIPMTVKKGDTVIVQSHVVNDTKKLKLEDTEYLLFREGEIVMATSE